MIEELVRRVNFLEQQIENLVKPEVGRWIDWTPTLTQSAAITLTINYARYITIANVVIMIANFDATSAGVAANALVVAGIPSAIQPTNIDNVAAIGSGIVFNSVGNISYAPTVIAVGANDFRFISDAVTPSNYVGANPSWAVASGDQISFMATYER